MEELDRKTDRQDLTKDKIEGVDVLTRTVDVKTVRERSLMECELSEEESLGTQGVGFHVGGQMFHPGVSVRGAGEVLAREGRTLLTARISCRMTATVSSCPRKVFQAQLLGSDDRRRDARSVRALLSSSLESSQVIRFTWLSVARASSWRAGGWCGEGHRRIEREGAQSDQDWSERTQRVCHRQGQQRVEIEIAWFGNQSFEQIQRSSVTQGSIKGRFERRGTRSSSCEGTASVSPLRMRRIQVKNTEKLLHAVCCWVCAQETGLPEI